MKSIKFNVHHTAQVQVLIKRHHWYFWCLPYSNRYHCYHPIQVHIGTRSVKKSNQTQSSKQPTLPETNITPVNWWFLKNYLPFQDTMFSVFFLVSFRVWGSPSWPILKKQRPTLALEPSKKAALSAKTWRGRTASTRHARRIPMKTGWWRFDDYWWYIDDWWCMMIAHIQPLKIWNMTKEPKSSSKNKTSLPTCAWHAPTLRNLGTSSVSSLGF